MLGVDAEPPAALVELVTARAQGNPSTSRSCSTSSAARASTRRTRRRLQTLELPESLHSLILSRIDALGEAPRRTLKVASVVGRVFRAPMLPGVYPELGAFDAGPGATCGRSARSDLVSVDQEAEQTYLFKHVVTQEVAYESMPFAFRVDAARARRRLHRGDRAGRDRAQPRPARAPLLAQREPARRSASTSPRAGDAAQAAYANAAAIEYFERLAPLVEQGERVDVLLKLGKVLELVGNWRRAEEVEGEALALAREPGRRLLARVVRDGAGRGRAQAGALRRGVRAARPRGARLRGAGRRGRRRQGAAPHRHRRGAARRLREGGRPATRRASPSASALDDKASMASLLSNLGVIAEYRGDYDRLARVPRARARAAHRDRRPLGDRQCR